MHADLDPLQKKFGNTIRLAQLTKTNIVNVDEAEKRKGIRVYSGSGKPLRRPGNGL